MKAWEVWGVPIEGAPFLLGKLQARDALVALEAFSPLADGAARFVMPEGCQPPPARTLDPNAKRWEFKIMRRKRRKKKPS